MPTTEVMTWDCPECCDGSPPFGDCSRLPQELPMTGVGGVLGNLGKVSDYHWRYVEYVYCLLEADVYCVDGVVTCTVTWGGVAVAVTVVSSNPVLITGTLGPANGSCTTPCLYCGQGFTITE